MRMLRHMLAGCALAGLIALSGGAGPASVAFASDSPPTCSVTLRAGPPTQADFTIQDSTDGLASIVVTRSDNADTPVPPFTAGTQSFVTVTTTKIDQSQAFTVELQITDVRGTQTVCTASDLGHIGSLTGADTPELGSGDLLATGLLPLGLALVLRRRRGRRAARQ